MIARWSIGILIFGLTLFGVVSQQQIELPNQEIILQFQDVNLTSKQTENTVAIVKQQLQYLGAQNIKVLSQENGKLKITYYSYTGARNIKEALLKESSLAIQITTEDKGKESSSFPFEDSDVSYNLDVYDIQNKHNSSYGWDLDGAIGLKIEPKSDRFLDPNYFTFENIGYQYEDNLIQVFYKNRKKIAIQISDSLHVIPEVRAGPIC